MKEHYAYAVARIRAKELDLLSDLDVSRLMACETYIECVNALKAKGWGDNEDFDCDYQLMLKSEEKKLWQLIWELVPDKKPFDVILLPIDYHNLKAAIKGYITESISENLFISGGTLDPEFLVKCVKENNFTELPEHMIAPAQEAFEKLLHTGDGQLCDIIIDKALLMAIKSVGQSFDVPLIKAYSELFVASADIKIALRGQAMQKKISFFNSALVNCESIDIKMLSQKAMLGQSDLFEYLEITDYADLVPFVRESLQKFDFWYDKRILDLLGAERYNSFSIGPIIAYIFARQNEIKVARIILSGKFNHVESGLIKERLRMMYA